MVITLQDDNVLRVYETTEMAARDVEALDAEDVFRAVFDEAAQPYVVEWIAPNKHTRLFFGLIRSSANGRYRLVRKGEPDPVGLLDAIRSAQAIDPPRFEPVVRELEDRLALTIPAA
jgi:hypothetical protein